MEVFFEKLKEQAFVVVLLVAAVMYLWKDNQGLKVRITEQNDKLLNYILLENQDSTKRAELMFQDIISEEDIINSQK